MSKRPISEGAESLLDVYTPILNSGFIALKDYMGNDASVVQMARMSYGEGTKTVQSDRGLLRYLMRMHHSSPFEGCVIKLHLKMPIFVMRQWVRHRTASLNEYSARYSVMKDEFYLPVPGVLAQQSSDNKQGRGNALTSEQAEAVMRLLQEDAGRAFTNYHCLLGDGAVSADNWGVAEYDRLGENPEYPGLSRELARINLPLSTYTELYWQTNLHNLMHFLKLRMDEHAQYEIRVYANHIYEMLKIWVPVVAEAFDDYVLQAYTTSRMEKTVLMDLLQEYQKLAGVDPFSILERHDHGMSKREIAEFRKAFGF